MNFNNFFSKWQTITAKKGIPLDECQIFVETEETCKFFRNSKIHSSLLMKGCKQICNGLWKKSHRRLCKNNYYKQDGKISGI